MLQSPTASESRLGGQTERVHKEQCDVGWNAAAASIGSTLGAAMSGGAMKLDLDRTVLLQMVLFAGLVIVLKPLLFDPVLRVFEEREKRTDGARDDARALQEQAGQLLRRYEREMERVQQVANEEREKLRSETTRLEAKILTEAREATAKIVDDGRADIQRRVAAVRADLTRETSALAASVTTRVLESEVTR